MDMSNVKVRYKQGFRVGTPVEVTFAALEKYRAMNNGLLDPEFVVKMSEPEDAPLHDELEWDDSVAGHKFRVEQMRYITRSIEVVRDEENGPTTRAYEAVRVEIGESEESEMPATRKVYLRTEDMLADPAMREALLQQAVRDAQAFQRKYAALVELAELVNAIDATVEKLRQAA